MYFLTITECTPAPPYSIDIYLAMCDTFQVVVLNICHRAVRCGGVSFHVVLYMWSSSSKASLHR